jgi:hypothetical protein
MQVGMVRQVRPPGVEHGEETDSVACSNQDLI